MAQDFRRFTQSIKDTISIMLSIKPSNIQIIPVPLPMDLSASIKCSNIPSTVHSGSIVYVQ